MYKYVILILIFLTSCSTDKNGSTGLMVEFIREPDQIFILDSNPEFSWVVPSPVLFQTAFQIQ